GERDTHAPGLARAAPAGRAGRQSAAESSGRLEGAGASAGAAELHRAVVLSRLGAALAWRPDPRGRRPSLPQGRCRSGPLAGRKTPPLDVRSPLLRRRDRGDLPAVRRPCRLAAEELSPRRRAARRRRLRAHGGGREAPRGLARRADLAPRLLRA